MSISPVRGACPRLTAPMETGDGLLARLVPSGRIAMDAFAALCAAARTHGNGLMEISARGSLQIRGLTASSAPLFANAVDALGIEHDDRVPVLANPLPLSANEPLQNVIADLRAAIAAQDFALAPKVSVVVDDGGALPYDTLSADIRLDAVETDGALAVRLGGDATSSVPLGLVDIRDVAKAVCGLLEVLAARGPKARARDVVREQGLGPFRAATRVPLAPAPARAGSRATEAIGLHRLSDGQCAVGVSLPFGQIQALDLIALLRIARANGAAWAATAPQRALLLGPIDEMTAFALGTAADTLGFIVDARDARRRVVACAGAPACRSGLIEARTLAAEIANELPQGSLAVHVSGCTKGCAHQRPTPLTIVGTAAGSALVRNGTAHDDLRSCIFEGDVVAEALRMVGGESADA